MRNKNQLFYAAVASFIFASCAQDEFPEQTTEEPVVEEQVNKLNGPTATIPAYEIISVNEEPNTRLLIDPTNLSLTWQTGDQFGIYFQNDVVAANTGYTILQGGTNIGVYGNDAFTMKPNTTYYAYFPHNAKGQVTACPIDFTGQVQYKNNDLSGIGDYNYMKAEFVTNDQGLADFTFEKIPCLVRLNITAPTKGVYKAANLVATQGVTPFVLTGNVNFTTGEITPLTTSTTHSIKLGENGIALEKGETITLYTMVAAQDFSNEIFRAQLVSDYGTMSFPNALKGKAMEIGKGYGYSASFKASTNTFTLKENDTYNLTLNGMARGNYSGITHVGGNNYVVVDDQGYGASLYNFEIHMNGASGRITGAFKTAISKTAPSDTKGYPEGVAYQPGTDKYWVSFEGKQTIEEFDKQGVATGNSLKVPSEFAVSNIYTEKGFKGFTYSENTGLFWTATEEGLKDESSNLIVRFQSYTNDLNPAEQYLYKIEDPNPTSIYNVRNGITGILALEDGRLIVMESESYVSTAAIQIFNTRLYLVDPFSVQPGGTFAKTELIRFDSQGDSQALYEGICLGPKMDNGKQTIFLLSDSQGGRSTNEYIKVLTIEK